MKKILVLLCFALPICFTAQSQNPKKKSPVVNEKANTVFVCDNGKTVVYHTSQSCSALRRCSHGVSQMKESAAKQSGLRPCKKC